MPQGIAPVKDPGQVGLARGHGPEGDEGVGIAARRMLAMP